MQLAHKPQTCPCTSLPPSPPPSPTYRTKGYAFLLPFPPSPHKILLPLRRRAQARPRAQKDHTRFANLSPSFLSSFLFYNPSNLQLPPSLSSFSTPLGPWFHRSLDERTNHIPTFFYAVALVLNNPTGSNHARSGPHTDHSHRYTPLDSFVHSACVH